MLEVHSNLRTNRGKNTPKEGTIGTKPKTHRQVLFTQSKYVPTADLLIEINRGNFGANNALFLRYAH